MTGPATATTAASDPSITTSHAKGPIWSVIDVTGTGFDPQASYIFCLDSAPQPSSCSFPMPIYFNSTTFSRLFVNQNSTFFYASGSSDLVLGSNISSGLTLIVYGVNVQQPGTYSIDVFLDVSRGQRMASSPFQLTNPDILITQAPGGAGNVLDLSGGGMMPSTAYVYCILPSYSFERPCSAGSPTFVTDADGNVPAGGSIQVPAGTPSGSYEVGFEQQAAGAVMYYDPFTVQGSTIVIQHPSSGSFPYTVVYVAVVAAVAGAIAVVVLARRRSRARRNATNPPTTASDVALLQLEGQPR